MIRSLVVTLTLCGPAAAETITVSLAEGDHTSINAAIAAARDGDVIQLAAETYFEGEPIDTLGKAITLRGVLDKGGEPTSVLDGSGMHRVLICQSGETEATVFENLRIQNGSGDIGGGMRNEESSPTLANCTFAGSSAEYGGGMYNADSSPTLADCAFTSNTADYDGGGMYNADSIPILAGCTFASNSADSGSGMYNYNSNPTLTDCTFTTNVADFGGGGMWNSLSSPTLSSCTFTSNSAYTGGGMFSRNFSSPSLADCTFTECCQVHPPRSFIDLGGNDYDSWCDDCRADVNCRDNAVNAADLGILIGSWGTSDAQCDINGDGTVSAADLGLLIGAWGPCQ